MNDLLFPILLLLPLATAVIVALRPAAQAKFIAFAGSSLTALWALIIVLRFDWSHGAQFLGSSIKWIPSIGLSLDMGVDSIALMLVALTAFVTPLAVLSAFSVIQSRQKLFYSSMLVLMTAMTGVFVARDIIVFYICFEFTLVPMYLLIHVYGSANRFAAAGKFFLYTFTGSMITLAGIVYIANFHHHLHGEWTFAIDELTASARQMSPTQQSWVLLALFCGLAVKIPLFPVHTWLPLAHTEAPTAGSVILAAVLLKLGTYGVFRFALPMCPDAMVRFAPVIAVLSIIGILYAALICWVQKDVKKLVAYSSVSHLGFCILGLAALNSVGIGGSVLYMINHGLSTGALFLCIGMIYDRYHTRSMQQLSGLAREMPVWAFFMVFFTMASVGLPGLNGFVSEFMCLVGTFQSGSVGAAGVPGTLGPWYAAVAGVGMIFAAIYLLYMVGKVVFGPLADLHRHPPLPRDLTKREIAILTPIAVACLIIGLYPWPLLHSMEGPIDYITSETDAAIVLLQNTDNEAQITPVVSLDQEALP